MGEVVFLGTGRAVPTLSQENTHFAVVGESGAILIDCSGSPYPRLIRAGVDPSTLSALILTHFHPDHASGVPSLLLSLWLTGRRSPLDIYALETAIVAAEQMMTLYEYGSWPGMYPVRYHAIPSVQGAAVLNNEDFDITAAPGKHMIPAIGLRIKEKRTAAVLVYSSDTEPSAEIEELARGADLLIHEATGEGVGHSSAAQAAAVAQRAGAKRLVLVHYDREAVSSRSMLRDARRHFAGHVALARDFRRFTW